MGRMNTYLTILICLDLLFIVTGQLCSGVGSCSFTSIIFSMIINPQAATFSTWWSGLIGNLGSLLSGNASSGQIGQLLASGATALIAAGSLIFGLKNDSILFAGTGLLLSLLAGDFILIYQYLASFNVVVATLLMSPIIVIYVFSCLEWVRGLS